MKIQPECAACIIHRGKKQLDMATKNTKLQLEVMKALFKFLSEYFNPEANPAWLGTHRDRLIKKMLGISDPYAKIKRVSNMKALEGLPIAESLVKNSADQKEQFRKACLCAIVGNIMEFDIPGHDFNYLKLKDFFGKC